MLCADSKYFGGQLEKMVRDHVVTVQTRNHTAASRLEVRGSHRAHAGIPRGRLLLQIGGGDRQGQGADPQPDGGAAGSRSPAVLIASAATFTPRRRSRRPRCANSTRRRRKVGPGSPRRPVTGGTSSGRAAGWSLRSADGVAQRIAQNYHYSLYLMSATSRGKFPPKFNERRRNTGGDLRTWGAQHWYANTSCYYEAIFRRQPHGVAGPVLRGANNRTSTWQRNAPRASSGVARESTSGTSYYFNGLEKRHRSGNAGTLHVRKRWRNSERFKEFCP